ncbi:unnamed protein product [Parnassius apollo]|uniref:(apollo) hypothetical protein n=1 Tax=Parnassius apollo TaxID=110799 RepID=A0A8S3WR64_PARAO|nr:unnamed protein product [Parnassius apollo]
MTVIPEISVTKTLRVTIMDARQQKRILHWLEEEEEEILGGEDDEDGNHIYPDETSEHNTDSEQVCDDGDPETQDHVSESSED